MRTSIAFAPVAVLAALGACSLPVIDKDADVAAKALYDEVRTGAPLSADPHAGPLLTSPAATELLKPFPSELPPGVPKSVISTGWSFNTTTATGTVATLSYRYDYDGGLAVFITDVLRKPPGQTSWTITGFTIEMAKGAAFTTIGEPAPAPAPSSSGSD
jgi:hypothetical protein